ncbi:DsbA family protein [Paenibacillus massiliensis]|nr:DsbA family protein [Paenibacillus massiliensis]
MNCNLETGVCGIGEDDSLQIVDLNTPSQKITLYYVTDPICSHCWALEPVLNRFLKQYGHYFKLQVVMGGLLPGWSGFADSANGIRQPADVAPHWREVGEHSRMPIDGAVWYNDPIQSSYPPSRVFKVIQKKDTHKALDFLRKAREAVFVHNQNIAKDDVLKQLVGDIGLNGEAVVTEAALDSSQALLDKDFELSARLGVRGFPTLMLVNEENQGVKVVGARSLDMYVEGLKQVLQQNPVPAAPPVLKDWLSEGHSIYAKELEIMYDLQQEDVAEFVERTVPSVAYQTRDVLGELCIIPIK